MNTKNKTIAVLMAAIIVSIVSVPALAILEEGVDTEAMVGGAGSAPFVCAKFETPDDRDDPDTQIEPIPGDLKTVKFYVVVGDPNGVDDIAAAYVKVYHPDGSFKFQLHAIRPTWTVIPWTGMIDMDGDCTGDTSVETALNTLDAQGRITYGYDPVRETTMDLDTLKYDIQNGKQLLIELVGEMHYHQPAGDYMVEAIATDEGGKTGILVNFFEYLSIVALRIDFAMINWGEVNTDNWNVLYGDEDLATRSKPTIQNIGNDPAKIELTATEMMGVELQKSIPRFDAHMRTGDIEFDANTPTVITDAGGNPVELPPCTPTQIDFSVHPPYGTPDDTYMGSMNIRIDHLF